MNTTSRLIGIGGLALLLSGCASRVAVRNYTLTPVAYQPLRDVTTTLPTLRVAPAVLPDYLQRGGIVTRVDDCTVKIAPNDQWAGDLGDGITRVLVGALGDCLGTARVIGPGQESRNATTILDTVIERCEPWQDGHIELVARWTIRDARGTVIASRPQTTYRTQAGELTYDAYAQAISKAVGALGRDIATAYAAAQR